MFTVFRHAMWDTPWWVNPNRSEGRYNAVGDPPVQYWCTHPLGPAAEFLRWQGHVDEVELADLRLRIWTAQVAQDGLVDVDFDSAEGHGIDPEDLVGDDFEPTQQLAGRLRSEGARGLLVPSAALPGTQVVVLFGPRLLFPYLLDPLDRDQVRTGHVADGFVAAEVVAHVRKRGEAHRTLEEWRESGRATPFMDPRLR